MCIYQKYIVPDTILPTAFLFPAFHRGEILRNVNIGICLNLGVLDTGLYDWYAYVK